MAQDRDDDVSVLDAGDDAAAPPARAREHSSRKTLFIKDAQSMRAPVGGTTPLPRPLRPALSSGAGALAGVAAAICAAGAAAGVAATGAAATGVAAATGTPAVDSTSATVRPSGL